MTHLKKLSSDSKSGELKSSLIKFIVAIDVIEDSLTERMPWEANLTLEKEITSGQFKQTKEEEELKQEADIDRIKYNKKENRYSQPEKKIMKQCKYCGRTHMRGACPAFHWTCNTCHKKDTLPMIACPLTNL